MKTKEELNALKEKEVESESKEPRKLTEEELAQVTGGASGETVFVQKESECVATIQPKATQMAGAGTIADR